MNKKQFWLGSLLTIILLIMCIFGVAATQKHIVIELDFYMDEESLNESKAFILDKYNMTAKEYMEYDIPNDWERWYTSELIKDLTLEQRRISNSRNNTMIKQATEALELI